MKAKLTKHDLLMYIGYTWNLEYWTEEDETDTTLINLWNDQDLEGLAVFFFDAGALEPNCKEAIELIKIAKKSNTKVLLPNNIVDLKAFKTNLGITKHTVLKSYFETAKGKLIEARFDRMKELRENENARALRLARRTNRNYD